MSVETLLKSGTVELTALLSDELLAGELGKIEGIRLITAQDSTKLRCAEAKEPTYGKAQWKSEVNRHRRYK